MGNAPNVLHAAANVKSGRVPVFNSVAWRRHAAKPLRGFEFPPTF
jgi:hypothetical protein